jgi:hypothetical protein
VALLDARPAGLDLLFRPDTTVVVSLAWPTGTLAGRSFSAALGSTSVTVDVAGDLMTVTVPDELTTLIPSGNATTWALRESIEGDDEVVILGNWGSSLMAAGTSLLSATVSDGDLNVDVTVTTLGGAALTAHAADAELHGGGIELDYDSRVTDLSITATGFALTEILRVTVPVIARPVYLEFDASVSASSGTASVLLALGPAGSNLLTVMNAAAEYSVPTTATEVNGRKVKFSARIAASASLGDYILAGNAISGSPKILATALQPTHLWAIQR